jgi:predicted aconitase with swiveling domain
MGARTGTKVPVIEGLLPTTTEDQLKALGAAAASSGGVALFHAIGVTPEAPTLDAAFQGRPPEVVVDVTMDDLRSELGVLSTAPDGPIHVVALGSPHFSLDEFAALLSLVERYPPRPDVELIACTHRLVLAALQQRGWLERLRAAGVQVIVDTCVVVTPIVRAQAGVLMTNSGKFAHYSPGNIGLQVVYGSLEECVRSAALGTVWRDEGLWVGEEGRSGQWPVASGQWSADQHAFGQSLDDGRGTMPRSRVLVSGEASGRALVLDTPLSLWGGLDPETGDIIDQRHPQWGQNVTGRVLVMPVGKGSSSASSILLEAVRLDKAPAAIVLAEPDGILALGAAVARELYGRAPAVVVADPVTYQGIRDGAMVEVADGGLR